MPSFKQSPFNYGSGRSLDAYLFNGSYIPASPIDRYVLAIANNVPKEGKILKFPENAGYYLETRSIYVSDIDKRPTIWVEILEKTGTTTAFEIVTAFTGVVAEIPPVILFPGITARVYHDQNISIPGIYFKLSICDVVQVLSFEAIK